MLFQPSAQKLTNRALSANKQYDAVIVPGVPFLEPKWDRTMQMRVMWAIHLYKNGSTKKIIMSGSSVYSPYVEGANNEVICYRMWRACRRYYC
jgi:hypothetical protein